MLKKLKLPSIKNQTLMIGMIRNSAYIVLLGCIFLLSSCEEGIKFPWSDTEDDLTEEPADSLAEEEGYITDSSLVTEEDSYDGSDSLDSPDEDLNYSQNQEDIQMSTAKKWRLVVSSMPSEERAESFIERNDLSGAEIVYIERLDTYRVIFASFTDLREAQAEYENLQNNFPNSWLVYF